MSASLEQGALGPESFASGAHDPATEIATKVMALPWASRGLTDPRSGVFDYDALGDRHGAIQTIADKVIRAASAPASGAERMTAGGVTQPAALYLAVGQAIVDTILPGREADFVSSVPSIRAVAEAAVAAVRRSATPAPATPPGVPDSVRALSEARSLLDGLLPGLSPEEHAKSLRSAASRATAEGATKRANRLFDKAEAIEAAVAFLATHPAGQSAGSGAVERSVEHAPQGGATTSARHNKPAPDSTRTGNEGTEATIARAAYARICRYDSKEGWQDAGADFDRREEDGGCYANALELALAIGSDAAAALAARPAAPEAQGVWRPISTAPRNDTLVMLGWWYDVNGEPRWVAVAGWYEAGPADQCWYAALDEERIEPTHWQPLDRLPAPPSPSGQGVR